MTSFKSAISLLGILCLLTASAASSATIVEPTPQAVPQGNILHIRLRQTISSFGSKKDDPISAILIQPVVIDGHIVLPLNTELRGTIVRVRRIGIGFSHETALLNLGFDTLILPDGQPQPLAASVTGVDNSRETVDAKGVIHGIRATASTSKVISGLAISAASLDPMSQLFAASAAVSAFRIPESEIILPVGTELTVRVNDPIPVSRDFDDIPPLLMNPEQQTQLTDLIHPLPFRTETTKPVTPSDLITLLYVGSEDSIRKAFDAAGWVPADPLSTQSKYGVMRSVIENQGYKEGPVSTLVLNGQPPTMVFSKTLDTFFARHHLRIYSQPGAFDGQPIFSSTATHDSGIGINKQTKSMIHLIDEHIDEERGKVIDDLWLTGCVEGVSYIDRPWVPRDAKNATGDTLITDGRIAVVRINGCANPHRADVPDSSQLEVRAKPPAVERFGRNTVLYLRDDAFRGNIVYQGYSGVRMVWGMTHKKDENSGEPKMLHVGGEQYEVVSRPNLSMPKGGPKDPGSIAPSFALPGAPTNYATHLEFSVSGGYSMFAGSPFDVQHITFTLEAPPPIGYTDHLASMNELQPGWGIAAKATLNSWRHFSNEFGYTYNDAALIISTASSVAGVNPAPLYDDGQIRQFSYNLLFHARPNGKRFRPYAAAGPVFQLIRLTDSKPDKNRVLDATVKDVGLIVDAYNFGSRPPLEGGGIFQFGVQYGGGVKYQITPRFFVRTDFRETLSPQPNWWGKSLNHLQDYSAPGLYDFAPGARTVPGPLRQQLASGGIGISF
ncbi:MAG TPA: LssY C-terminal domain-containing protein [Terriglobales bacterium]